MAEHWTDNRYLKFIQNIIYLFTSNYFVPFKVTPLKYNTLMTAFSAILETLLKFAF